MSESKLDESIPRLDLLSIQIDPNPSEFEEPVVVSLQYQLSGELLDAFWECEVILPHTSISPHFFLLCPLLLSAYRGCG